MSTCNRLDLQRLGSQPIMHAQTISPIIVLNTLVGSHFIKGRFTYVMVKMRTGG